MQNPDSTDLPDTIAALTRTFAPTPPPEEEPVLESLEALQRFLTGHITTLLDRNPSLLLSILYRIDVSEKEVQRVFSSVSPDLIPSTLADLMIERQQQKIRYRRKYQSGASE